MKNHNEMTLEECRDEIAEGMGLVKQRCENNTGLGCPIYYAWFHKDGRPYDTYFNRDGPVPFTLDAAAAAMPEGWQMQNIGWHVHGQAEPKVCAFATKGDWRETVVNGVEDKSRRALGEAPTELLARMRLAVACLRANTTTKAGG